MRSLVVVLLLGATLVGQDVPQDDAPAIDPHVPDAARDARIETLIDELPSIREPWHGISDKSGGGIAFDAVEPRGIVPTVLRDLPRDGPPRAFRELVRLGPAAVPALLKHLEDARATELTFRRQRENIGGVFTRRELFAGSQTERTVIARILGARGVANPRDDAPPPDLHPGTPIQQHTVTVGDCCFAILGQIVNRPYEAVRYQPSLITIVTSPTRDAKVAEAVRSLWGRGDPRQILARSLRNDLRSGDADEAGAALRLVTYFPKMAGTVVAEEIARRPWRRRQRERNHELLRTALSFGDRRIREAWLKLLDRGAPAEAKLAALWAMPPRPGADVLAKVRVLRDESRRLDVVADCVALLPGEPSPEVFAWLEGRLAAVETRDPGRTQVILTTMARLDDARSVPIFVAHIEKLDRWGRGNALAALEQAPRPALAAALLPSVLKITDPVGSLGAVAVPVPRDTRWCDWAAAILARARPEFAFDRNASVEVRDRQIAAIRERLAR